MVKIENIISSCQLIDQYVTRDTSLQFYTFTIKLEFSFKYVSKDQPLENMSLTTSSALHIALLAIFNIVFYF